MLLRKPATALFLGFFLLIMIQVRKNPFFKSNNEMATSKASKIISTASIHEAVNDGPTVQKVSEMQNKHEEDYIFFVTLKKFRKRSELFNPTHFCAFESSARNNPHKLIRVVMEKGTNWSLKHKYLEQLKNLKFEFMDYNDLVEGTPIRDFWHSDKFGGGYQSIAHRSDAVRYALIHKFGGLYLDTDVISLKPWPEDFRNFIATESSTRISNAVFHMDKGSSFLWKCMINMATKNSAKTWGITGPLLFIRVSKQFVCSNTTSRKIGFWNCPDLKILQPWHTAPLWWQIIGNLINKDTSMEKLYETLRESYVLHLFYHVLFKRNVTIVPKMPLYEIMRENCPGTFQNFKTLF